MNVRAVHVDLPVNLSLDDRQRLKEANENRPGSREPLRGLLAQRADIVALFGEALANAELAVIRLGTSGNVLQEEVVRRKLEDVRAQLRMPEDGSLEHFLIGRIAVSSMLSTYLVENLANRLAGGVDPTWANTWSKLASRAQRDLLHATRTLAAVRACGNEDLRFRSTFNIR